MSNHHRRMCSQMSGYLSLVELWLCILRSRGRRWIKEKWFRRGFLCLWMIGMKTLSSVSVGMLRVQLARDAKQAAAAKQAEAANTQGAEEQAEKKEQREIDQYQKAFEHQEDVAVREIGKVRELLDEDFIRHRDPNIIVDGKPICVHPEQPMVRNARPSTFGMQQQQELPW